MDNALRIDPLFESGDAVQEPCSRSHTKAGCDDDSGLLGLARRKLGVSCQEIFRRAYASKYGDVYARGVFVLYVDTNRVAFPPIVRAYCERVIASMAPHQTIQRVECLGCRLNPKEWAGLVSCYRMITPEVTKETLLGLKRAPPKEKPKPADPLEYRTRLFEELLKSGVLDEGSAEFDWNQE